ncbi:META domain-containing protein [Flavobacterium sp. GT2N3]|uniref:META domain-containing protein n=1 Tax=unclassified Flavobacterium TaxID=196869 RepID=UPI003AAA9A0E
MKKIILSLTVLLFVFISCNSLKTITGKTASLEGTWELNYVTVPSIAFDGLYPNKKPTINFDLKENRFSGDTSCNNYTGKLSVKGNTISFKGPITITKKMCLDGNGESVYVSLLEKIDSYSVSEDGKILNFIMGDIAVMRFEKK